VNPPPSALPTPSTPVSLRDLGAFLMLYRWVIGGCTGLAFLLATVLAYGLPPSYTAHAQVFVERGKDPTLRTELTSLSVEVNESIETEIQFMNSRTVAETVVDSLGLDRLPRKPSVMRSITEGISDTLDSMGLVAKLDRRAATVRGFSNTLRCKQPPLTWTITMRYSAEDPVAAAQILDRTLDVYLEHRRSVNRNNAAETFKQRKSEIEAALNNHRANRLRTTDPGVLHQIDLEIRTLETAYITNHERLDRALAEAVADPSLYNVRVIDRPKVPNSPDMSRLLMILAGTFAGLVCGLFASLLRAHFDQTVRTPDDLKRCGLEVLGSLPKTRQLGRNQT